MNPLYFVECDFGKIGTAFVETDRFRNSRQRVLENIAEGQYGRILRILEVVEDEGTCRDVTEDMLEAAAQFKTEREFA